MIVTNCGCVLIRHCVLWKLPSNSVVKDAAEGVDTVFVLWLLTGPPWAIIRCITSLKCLLFSDPQCAWAKEALRTVSLVNLRESTRNVTGNWPLLLEQWVWQQTANIWYRWSDEMRARTLRANPCWNSCHRVTKFKDTIREVELSLENKTALRCRLICFRVIIQRCELLSKSGVRIYRAPFWFSPNTVLEIRWRQLVVFTRPEVYFIVFV